MMGVMDREKITTLSEFVLGNALYHLKKYDEAISYYDKILEQVPGNLRVSNNKMMALILKKV